MDHTRDAEPMRSHELVTFAMRLEAMGDDMVKNVDADGTGLVAAYQYFTHAHDLQQTHAQRHQFVVMGGGFDNLDDDEISDVVPPCAKRVTGTWALLSPEQKRVVRRLGSSDRIPASESTPESTALTARLIDLGTAMLERGDAATAYQCYTKAHARLSRALDTWAMVSEQRDKMTAEREKLAGLVGTTWAELSEEEQDMFIDFEDAEAICAQHAEPTARLRYIGNERDRIRGPIVMCK